MTDHRAEGPGENGAPVPRDLPDQQADAGEDPWDVAPGLAARGDTGADEDEDGTDVPDTDEAGTGRRGAPHASADDPDQPVPDEPSA
ncbi:hypothetical protein [Streptomyces fumanus]|uniref:Uncharacterized protein n=1 Tax=Streptomyces fumanus TaxID=67302 RepID=A0A919ADE4_9ACTN|nr:hypothetical protein [Streptomyces fumanus]GHF00163.1 hypothetical protein GCM10018772_25850 [Streptomyces fumanus]